MKKTYIYPTVNVLRLKTKIAILTTSALQKGEDINSGQGDARAFVFEYEE